MRGGSVAGCQRLTAPPSLLPAEGGASGSQAWTLAGEAEGSTSAAQPRGAVPQCQLSGPRRWSARLPCSPPRPWPLGVGLTAQDVGWPLGGSEHSIRACRVTGQGHRVLGLLCHPVVPPWCRPRPPSAGQEQPCWLGCRLPGSSGRGAACPCPATGVAAVAATRTTPPARGPGLSGPGGHGRVTAGQTEGVGCCLARPNGQLFAGACGRDRNCPSAGPAGDREERAVGVSSGRVWARSRFCLLKE